MAGRHERSPSSRADAAPPATLGRNLILAASLAAVVAIVFLALHLTGSHGKQSAAQTASTHSASQGAGQSSRSSGPSGARPTTTPAAATSASPTGGAVATTSARPSTTRSSPSPSPGTTTAEPPGVPLLVLNNSSIDGLGLRAANDFRRGGWTVAGVGNLTGRLRDTTVYYEPGYDGQAHALAAQFPQVHRVLPRIKGLPGEARLTVVVTRYYDLGASS